MAKTEGSLFSLGAHGSVGKTLTFSQRKSGQQCRSYNKPLKSPSPKQRGQRRLTEFLVAQWQNMSGVDKATWDTLAGASSLNIAGYHYFLREAQRDLYTHHGLLLYSHLNEYVSGKVKDLSGNNQDGTPGPSYPSNAPTLVESKSAKFSKALSFDGVDEYVNFGNNAIFDIGTGDFTVIFWLFLTEYRTDQEVFSKRSFVSVSKGILFNYWDTGNATFELGDGSSSVVISGDNMPLNQWFRVVGRRIGTSLDLFYDLTLKANDPSVALNANTTNPLVIGSDSWLGRNAYCTIDEICFYNRGLSNAELTTRYNFALREAS